MEKFKSRKFLISLAAFLGSIGASIAGIYCSNTTVTTVGIVCSIISAAIYAACEAYVDAAAVDMTVLEVDQEPKEVDN